MDELLEPAEGLLTLCSCGSAAHKYGDATFYCWLKEIQLMFLTFYVFYVAMVVFNFVLLVLIHVNMKQRVARYVRHRARLGDRASRPDRRC